MLRPHAWFVLAILPSLIAQELRRTEAATELHGCYDPGRGRVVVVGHGNYSREWDGVAWRRAPDVGAPAGFVYCDAAGRIVAFHDPALGDSPNTIAVRTGARWQALPTAGGPPTVLGPQFVYDPVHDVLIRFGGLVPTSSAYSNETWLFNGSTWTQAAPALSPPGRTGAAFAYDEARQRAVLFGGSGATAPGVFGDTWEWDGATWAPRPFAVTPSPRRGAGAAYDRIRQRVVLVGGIGTGTPDEHWEYDGAQWTQLAPLPATIAVTYDPTLVYDAARSEMLLLGTTDTVGSNGLVHAFVGTTWQPRPGLGRTPWQEGGIAIAADATGVVRFGGQELWSQTTSANLWRWDGSTWSLLASGGPPARCDAALWYQHGLLHVFGGRTPNAGLGDTWRWNGTWAQINVSGPIPRHFAGIAYDTVRDRAVLFGGDAVNSPWPQSDTWLFNGTAWQQAFTPTQPAGRLAPAMAFDTVRGRVVLAGGVGVVGGLPTWLTDTWEWDGAVWQQVLTASAVPVNGTAAFDVALGRVVYAAPSGTGITLRAFDGVDWTAIPAVAPAAFLTPYVYSLPRAVTSPGGRFTLVDDLGISELLPTPARAAVYGAGCTTAAPVLSANGLPILGDAAFALELTRLPANGIGLVAASDTAANVPVLGCTLLVAPIVVLAALASPTGFVSTPVPLPVNPTLLGQAFYFQAAALTPVGPAGLAFSAGLRLDLGQ